MLQDLVNAPMCMAYHDPYLIKNKDSGGYLLSSQFSSTSSLKRIVHDTTSGSGRLDLGTGRKKSGRNRSKTSRSRMSVRSGASSNANSEDEGSDLDDFGDIDGLTSSRFFNDSSDHSHYLLFGVDRGYVQMYDINASSRNWISCTKKVGPSHVCPIRLVSHPFL